MSFLRLSKSTHTICVSLTKGHNNHCQIHTAQLGETLIMTLGQEFFDTTLEDTLNNVIQNHSLALTKLEIQVGQIVQALNEHQSDGDDQEEKEEQPKEACCAYFHKPYVPPIHFPGRFVKQKHDESPINVLGETVPDIVFEALPISSNLIEWRQKSHHNQVIVEIQCTIFKVPRKKPLLPTKVRRYLDFLPP
ncbi:unnamed protein product [Malus baccata var. baccata]